MYRFQSATSPVAVTGQDELDHQFCKAQAQVYPPDATGFHARQALVEMPRVQSDAIPQGT